MTLQNEVQQAVEALHASLKQLPDDHVCSLEDLYPDEVSDTTSASMYLLLIENEMAEYERKSMTAELGHLDEDDQLAYTALQTCATRLRRAGVRPPEGTPLEE